MYYISGTEFKGQQIKMIRLLLILSMVCTLSHALICQPCPSGRCGKIARPVLSYSDKTKVDEYKSTCDYCNELKCCPSGEVTPEICGCCYVCANGTVYIL